MCKSNSSRARRAVDLTSGNERAHGKEDEAPLKRGPLFITLLFDMEQKHADLKKY